MIIFQKVPQNLIYSPFTVNHIKTAMIAEYLFKYEVIYMKQTNIHYSAIVHVGSNMVTYRIWSGHA